MTFPIYALWAHPRSMSTATERIMRQRGDLECFHEPFMYDFYVNRAVRQMPLFEPEEEKPHSFQEIRAALLGVAQSRPVFLKDMSYYLSPYLEREAAFLAGIRSAFLIRDPVAAILSYFKLDHDVTLEEIGLEAQWRHYAWLREKGQDPIVLKSEDIRAEPEGMMQRLWAKWGLSNQPEALAWGKTTPADWGQVDGWHSTSISETGIKPMVADEIESRRKEFEVLAIKHPRLLEFLAHHQPFYDKLAKAAV